LTKNTLISIIITVIRGVIKYEKRTKLALIGVSCCLLASLVRACAPEYEATYAKTTNNQTPAYNYSEYFDKIDERMEQLTGTEQSKGLNK
jgi:hypothetical protein